MHDVFLAWQYLATIIATLSAAAARYHARRAAMATAAPLRLVPPPTTASSRVQFCDRCGEPIGRAPAGSLLRWLHLRTVSARCDLFDPVTGKQFNLTATPAAPDAVVDPPEDSTDMMPAVGIVDCRNCGASITQTPRGSAEGQSPTGYSHIASGRYTCWTLPEGHDRNLFGQFAEPPRRCSACKATETPEREMLSTQQFGVSGEPPRWECKDVADCTSRRAVSERLVAFADASTAEQHREHERTQA